MSRILVCSFWNSFCHCSTVIVQLLLCSDIFCFTDRISVGGNALTSVRLSAVRLSVRLFPLYLRNGLTGDLNVLHEVVGHDHSSQKIEGKGHRSRSRSHVRLMRLVWPRSWAVFLLSDGREFFLKFCLQVFSSFCVIGCEPVIETNWIVIQAMFRITPHCNVEFHLLDV